MGAKQCDCKLNPFNCFFIKGFYKTFQTVNDERQSEKIAVAKLDLTFLILFPLFFFIFNFTYWISYLTL